MSKVILLMGPTASGKTQLAIELAQEYPIEIISVDSAMIYQGMDIGTGKPTKEELEKAPHHLIDFLDPKESYSAVDFCKDALKLIENIHSRKHIPLLVGGTMLYFHALVHGISVLPEADLTIRQQLEQEKNTEGLAKMHQRLSQIDKAAAERIHPNDPQRILRALEVFEITGKPMSDSWQSQSSLLADHEVFQLALFPTDRQQLHQAIANRLQYMLDHGFVEEVQALRARSDLQLNLPSMRCVGYRQIWQYLENKFDYQTMQEKALAATRQLAKRQLTWLRHWENAQYFNDAAEIKAIIKL